MHGKAVLLVALLLGSGLVGCLKPSDKGPEVTQQSTNNSTLLPNETKAPDGRGGISAFNETNKTETTGIGSMQHTHDYWKGKERVTVGYLPVSLIPFPLFTCKRPAGDCTTGSTTPSTDGSGDTYPPGSAIADLQMSSVLPAGSPALVYEGTKTVEVTMTAYSSQSTPAGDAPGNPAGQVFFDYLAANDEPGHFHKGGELKLGQPVKIDIQPTDADMPHQQKSLWIFRVYSNTQMVAFTANVTITNIKGYAVVNWPPHPNLYADKKERTVFSGPVTLSSKGTADWDVWGSDSGWVHPQRVISWGTDRVEISIENVQFKSDSGAPITPSSWVFEYNNASKPILLGNGAQFSYRLRDAGTDGKSYHFVIDLTKDRGDAYDTPYGQYSRWGFRLLPQFDQGQNVCQEDNGFAQEFLNGCEFFPWSATYTMKVVAIGHSTAEGVPAGQAQ